MALDASIYNAVDTKLPERLSSLLDPANIQERKMKLADLDTQRQTNQLQLSNLQYQSNRQRNMLDPMADKQAQQKQMQEHIMKARQMSLAGGASDEAIAQGRQYLIDNGVPQEIADKGAQTLLGMKDATARQQMLAKDMMSPDKLGASEYDRLNPKNEKESFATTEVQDPANPSRMLRVNTSTYIPGTTLGGKGVLGVSGKVPGTEKSPAQLFKETMAESKAADKEEKARNLKSTAIAKANIVINKVDDALKKTGFFTTGLTGAVLSKIPGTEAFDLDKTVDTIKANIGFQELADMRAASPTGGALGQVAVRELEFLQATIASLDSGLSYEEKVKVLNQIKTHYQNWKNTVESGDKPADDEGWSDL